MIHSARSVLGVFVLRKTIGPLRCIPPFTAFQGLPTGFSTKISSLLDRIDLHSHYFINILWYISLDTQYILPYTD